MAVSKRRRLNTVAPLEGEGKKPRSSAVSLTPRHPFPLRGKVGMGVGLQSPMDSFHNCCRVTQNLMIPESEHPKPGLIQHSVPNIIFYHSLDVLAAIYLNNKFRFEAYKIEYVISVWMLSSKLESVNLPFSQMAPDMLLRSGHAFTQNTLQSFLPYGLISLSTHLP